MSATKEQLGRLQAYNQGFRASMDWKKQSDCPFPPSVDEWYWWQRGWLKSQEIYKNQVAQISFEISAA